MPFGLSDDEVSRIHQVLRKLPKLTKVLIYGSRAKGNFKPSSDIDLTLIGENLSFSDLAHLDTELDDLLLPYTFDLSIYLDIENPDLKDHIDRVGKVFYQLTATTTG